MADPFCSPFAAPPCSITYDFNSRNESFEWLDLTAHMQEGQVKMLPDKVDLRNFPNSRAGAGRGRVWGRGGVGWEQSLGGPVT